MSTENTQRESKNNYLLTFKSGAKRTPRLNLDSGDIERNKNDQEHNRNKEAAAMSTKNA